MPKLLYLVTEDWFFCSHFLPMARAARALGLDVVVATRVRDHRARIEAEGLRVVALDAARGSLDPRAIAAALGRMKQVLAQEKPDIVHAIALQNVIVGGLAARLAGIERVVLAPTGLGHLWISSGLVHRGGRAAIRWIVRRLLDLPHTRFLFENAEDPLEFGLSDGHGRVVLVGGAGVDPAAFPVRPEPDGPVRIAVVARMLWPKGIATAVRAVEWVRARGVDVHLDLFGDPDPSNRRSIPEAVLRDWSARPAITWHGRSDAVAEVWANAHIGLLLSDREGLPRSLVEAMACGRPVIATDVPGCRTLVRHETDGLIVAPADVEATGRAIIALAGDRALRARMGAAARARIEAGFTEAAVQKTVGALYRDLLSRT